MSRVWLCLVAGLLLAGCAETQLASHAFKRAYGTGDGETESPTGPGRGVYKVGDPYQINGVWFYPAEDYSYDETGIASWYGPGFHEKYTANGETFDQNLVTAAHRTLPMPCFVRVTNLDNGRSIVARINDRGPYARGRILDMSRRAAQLLGYEQIGTAKVRVQVLAEESKQLAMAMRAEGQVSAGSRVASGGGSGATYANRPGSVAELRPGEAPAAAAPRVPVNGAALTPPPAAAKPALAVASLPDPTASPPIITAVKRTAIYVQVGAFANGDNATRLSNAMRQIGPTSITTATVNNTQFYRVRVGPLATVDDADKTLEQVFNAGHPEARIVVD
jgi:rare lipoprotein A